ncbi:MAG: DUF1823 family protein [Cyanobacteria bacterium CRU_2_1]|nr:DUF1823 family protein [Cyanobacteria bacterium RU_5_0]NJR61543.1 DUF1823 family protein [Cyanobacteria bacterium CRU_2_1]
MTNQPDLSDTTFWAILKDEMDDASVNQLVWYYLGYRFDEAIGKWETSEVAVEWRDAYPEPPDFVESRPAIVKLTRSIPQENKQLLKEELRFAGYQVTELVPRKTRRATIVNWLLSYRKEQR